MDRIIHPIAPFVMPDSRVLVLGSFPSVKSRESGFYYGHPRNRFWQVLAQLFNENAPDTLEAKQALLAAHKVALWDVIHSCAITGSSDASIKDAQVNQVAELTAGSGIRAVFLNGQQAGRLYTANLPLMPKLPCHVLPSTSPANAAWDKSRLVSAWSVILEYMK